MHRTLLILALSAVAAGAADIVNVPGPAEPPSLIFDRDTYHLADKEVSDKRIANRFLRTGETTARFSRQLVVADLPTSAGAKAAALGVLDLAKLRTPGREPATYAAEGAQDKDLTVAFFDLTDDNTAVQYHVVRFVALDGGGVREYHFILRAYTNGDDPDAVLKAITPNLAQAEAGLVEQLAGLSFTPLR